MEKRKPIFKVVTVDGHQEFVHYKHIVKFNVSEHFQSYEYEVTTFNGTFHSDGDLVKFMEWMDSWIQS